MQTPLHQRTRPVAPNAPVALAPQIKKRAMVRQNECGMGYDEENDAAESNLACANHRLKRRTVEVSSAPQDENTEQPQLVSQFRRRLCFPDSP